MACRIAGLALLALAGCIPTAIEPETGEARTGERLLFTDTYRSVVDYHIEAVSPETLALASLAELSSIDAELSVGREAGELVLRHGDAVRRLPAPAPRAIGQWGDATAETLDLARLLSPSIAAMPADRLDEVVIDAGLATLDPYSRYERPVIAREVRAQRDGFGGIGITLAIRGSEVRIASVLPDTPAAAAGLKAGDRILAIDGIAGRSLAAAEVHERLRGEIGTAVVLTIRHGTTAKPITVTLERAEIVEPSVTMKLAHGIAWLRIRTFNQQTGETLQAALRQAHRSEGAPLHGIVLDLRDNPGGLLDQSIEVARLFLDGGTIVSTVGRNPRSFQHFAAPRNGTAERLPLVVLVNGGSASAAEIVASALQDADRAVVIGSASFGKGTVQNVIRMPNDGELTVTWARLVTPRGYILHQHGVVPTLCTAGLGDGDAGVTAALAAATSDEAALAQPREKLDEAGWTALRAACPAARTQPPLDAILARRVIDDPVLYARALTPSPAGVAHRIEARAQP